MKFRLVEENELDKRAKKHRKKQKGMSPFYSPDGGNVPLAIDRFNSSVADGANGLMEGLDGYDIRTALIKRIDSYIYKNKNVEKPNNYVDPHSREYEYLVTKYGNYVTTPFINVSTNEIIDYALDNNLLSRKDLIISELRDMGLPISSSTDSQGNNIITGNKKRECKSIIKAYNQKNNTHISANLNSDPWVLIINESLKEDTIKNSDGTWSNKGDEGSHGKFKTKKKADAQRKAMFANGYKESLIESNLPSQYDGSYGFVSMDTYKKIKKLSDKLTNLLNKYDEVIDSMESSAKTDKDRDALEVNQSYNTLIKTYQNNYETINMLSDMFKNNLIQVDKNAHDENILIDLDIYGVSDLQALYNNLQNILKSIYLKENLRLKNEFLGEDMNSNDIIKIYINSGISGDGFTIAVEDSNHNIIDKKSYHYGYNASYDKRFADSKKPYVTDIINDWCDKYNQNIQDVQIIPGTNTFKGDAVSSRSVDEFKNKYLSEDYSDEKLYVVIYGPERNQEVLKPGNNKGTEIKKVRDKLDWFSGDADEVYNELKDFYNNEYYEDCICKISGKGWTADLKDFLDTYENQRKNESLKEAWFTPLSEVSSFTGWMDDDATINEEERFNSKLEKTFKTSRDNIYVLMDSDFEYDPRSYDIPELVGLQEIKTKNIHAKKFIVNGIEFVFEDASSGSSPRLYFKTEEDGEEYTNYINHYYDEEV